MDRSGPGVIVAPAVLKSFCVDVLRRMGVPFEKGATGVERIFLPGEREYLLLEEQPGVGNSDRNRRVRGAR